MNPKISADHLKRRAIVYIRQSSPGQVIHNQESKFQPEDRRLLENLSGFASQAFKVLASVGALDPLLGRKA